MPLVKATLPTALSTVRQFIGDLKKTVRETGSSPALDNLATSLDALAARRLPQLPARLGVDEDEVFLLGFEITAAPGNMGQDGIGFFNDP